jgi:uncharacterized membrane protein YqjE
MGIRSSAIGGVQSLSDHARFPYWVMAAAVAVRLAWVAWIPTEPSSDFAWYFQLGLRLSNGLGYTVADDGFPLWEPGRALPQPRPTAFWPVGYPGFLAVLFSATRGLDPLWAAKLANVVLYAGLMLSAAYVARTVFASVLAGRIALVTLALAPNQIAYTSLISVEIWFSFLALTGVALTLHATRARHVTSLLLAGICFGLATLTKPQAVLLPALVLWVLRRELPGPSWRAPAIVYLCVASCVAPWSLRNSLAFGTPLFVSNNGGINLLIGNMPGSWGQQGLMWNHELHRIIETHVDEATRDSAARRTALAYMLENPLEVLVGLPKKLFWLYAADVDGFGWNRSAAPRYAEGLVWTALRAVSQAYYLAIVLVASIGVLQFSGGSRGGPHSAHFWLGPAVLAYFTAVYLVFFGGARFHFPFVPWLAIYAAGALAARLTRGAQGRLTSSVPAA